MVTLMSHVYLQITPWHYNRMKLHVTVKTQYCRYYLLCKPQFMKYSIPYIWLNLSIQIPAQLLLSRSDIIS